MKIAIIIPFRGNPSILQWTLEGFAQQQLPPGATVEVRLLGDGVPVPPLPPSTDAIRFTSTESPRVGVAQAKNILLQQNPAPDIVIFANSDTRPTPTFAAAHAKRLLSLPPNHMVLGSAPYESPADPTVLDALIEHTPMIFFYNQLTPHNLVDFRHSWTLNLSARFADLQRINFFDARFRPYGYEDLDLGHRLLGESKSIYYDPAPQVLHRHPMTFEDYLNREELLGIMTPVLHHANAVLFEKLHHTTDLAQLTAQFQTWLQLDKNSHKFTWQRLKEWLPLPASSLGEADTRTLLTLYQLHIPLKRLAFRLGFLQGLQLANDTDWQKRTPQSLWRTYTT